MRKANGPCLSGFGHRLHVKTILAQSMRNKHRLHTIIACCATLLFLFTTPLRADTYPTESIRKARLDEALKEALENNLRRPASRFAVAIAEAQHRQALAAYWPQISLKGGWQRLDESPNFIVAAGEYTLPRGAISLPAGTSVRLNTPEGPQDVTQLTLPDQHINILARPIKLEDKESFTASLQAKWLIYDGGMRKGYREQTRANIDMMKQEARRTDLEIIDSVYRYYYGAVLARQLHQVGVDTLARMEVTLDLTEAMYKGSTGHVKKTDWLSTKVMVASLRAMVALLEKNKIMSQAALANVMGLRWHTNISPVENTIPFEPYDGTLEDLVRTAYQFNPDWIKMRAAIRAAQGAEQTANSGHLPKVAITGELHKWWNSHDAGNATNENKQGGELHVGVELPIFKGFLTHARVSESRAKTARIKAQKMLLKEGIGLQIRDVFMSLIAVVKGHSAKKMAMEASKDNLDLNTRAYQHGLVETEDVIQAQWVAALMAAQYYKACYDHIALQSQLNLRIGSNVLDMQGEE